MYDRILIPIDGSDCASRALRHGCGLATAYDAVVDVVHVLDTGGILSSLRGDQTQSVRERAEEILEAAGATATEYRCVVTTHLEEGTPSKVIRAFADEHDSDVIVMGRHGHTGVRERLMGGTTESVIRRTDRPVLTVATADPSHEPVGEYEQVLVPTDGSDNAEAAVPDAVDVASQFDATIHGLLVVDVQTAGGMFDAGGVSTEFIERLEATGQEAVDRLLDGVRDHSPDLATRSAVRRGKPDAAIQEYVAENDVDLVVMASHGRSNVGRQLLGSVTERVLRVVDVPVLVVKRSTQS